MTQEKHDPWALLRQAQGWIGYWPLNKPEAGAEALKKRIDAALAKHDAVPPSEVVWKTTYHDPVFHEADLTDDLCLSVLENPHGRFYWSAQLQTQKNGYANTLDEAKSAAIAAARGMK